MIAKEEILDTLSRNLNTLMRRKQLGVRELARECGLSAMTISRICNARPHMPSLDVALRLAEFFQISVEELVEKKIH